MNPRALLPIGLSLILAYGCGTEGGGVGGATGLPNRGVQSYDLVTLDSDGDPETAEVPFVLAPAVDSGERWHSPSAAIVDGALMAVWVIDASDDTQKIVSGRSVDDGLSWSTPKPLLATANVTALVEDGENTDIQGPGLLVGAAAVGTKPAVPWLLAFGVGDGAGIAMARSVDGGVWVVDESFYIEPQGTEEEVRSPSLVRTDNGLEVFYEASLSDGRRVIRRAIEVNEPSDEPDAPPIVRVEKRGTVLAAPGVDCSDAFGAVVKCWDIDGVGAPEVRWAQRASDGSYVYRLWYVGYRGSKGDIGFAASADGQTWSRHATNPAIESSAAENEPTNVVTADRYLMLYTQKITTIKVGISLAVDSNGAPAEAF